MKILVTTVLLFFSAITLADIPAWYKQDIVKHLENAKGVVIYQVVKVTPLPRQSEHYSYRVDSKTIEEIKGSAPKGACYIVATEDEWDSAYEVNDKRIVILNQEYKSECGTIESGFGAPATKEYVELFRSIITKHNN